MGIAKGLFGGKIRQKNLTLVMLVFLALFLPSAAFVTNLILQRISTKEYEEHIALAGEYYQNGEYEESVEYYQLAWESKESKESEIIMPLAHSYIALEEYEEAAQILEDYYRETGDTDARKLLTEVFDLIKYTNYETAMERGKLFLEDEEYDKAIRQFSEAVEEQPDEVEAVEYLVTAYIAIGNTEKADEVCKNAKECFSDDDIADLEKAVTAAVKNQTYEELLDKAEELFHQESYEECFATYKEAIELCPTKLKGYQNAVKAYQSLRKYDEAIELLKSQVEKHPSKKLSQLIENCEALKKNEVIRYHIFEQLYDAFQEDDMDEIYLIVSSSDYSSYIDQNSTIYYSRDGEDATETVPLSQGMILYKNGYIYCGAFEDSERCGQGSYFSLSDNLRGYLYFSGIWKDDKPNGEGIYYTTMEVPWDGTYEEYNVTVKGDYCDGLESGDMKRTLYKEGEYFANLEYECSQGIPQAKDKVKEQIPEWRVNYSYYIGDLVTESDSARYFYSKTEDNTTWGIGDFVE